MQTNNKISKILNKLTGFENIKLEENLQLDLAMDSISMVTLLIEIEEAFEITLDEADMNPFNLITVKDIVDMVGKYTGEKSEKEG